MFSAMRPAICEWAPQALLPTMPPMAQWLWVAGSGPKVRPWAAAAWSRASR